MDEDSNLPPLRGNPECPAESFFFYHPKLECITCECLIFNHLFFFSFSFPDTISEHTREKERLMAAWLLDTLSEGYHRQQSQETTGKCFRARQKARPETLAQKEPTQISLKENSNWRLNHQAAFLTGKPSDVP